MVDSGGKWGAFPPRDMGASSGVFMGEYQHSLDSKGRLIIPARFRESLGERFVVTRGLDQCLFAFPAAEWSALEEKVRALPMTQAGARAFARLLFSGATECEVDKQGRIMLPAALREYARMEKDVVAIGVSTRVELWASEVWSAYSAEAAAAYAEIAEQIVDLGV